MTSPFRRFTLATSVALTILAWCAKAALAIDPAVLAEQQRRVEVVQRVAPSVVAIFPPGGGGGGSGVLISPDGYVVTNFHVTNGAGNFMKCGLNDGVLYDAVLVGIDPTGDVAIIRMLGRDDFPCATLGDSDKVEVGDWAYAMGNPFLLANDFQPTVTYGIVSGTNRYQEPAANNFLEYTDCIQIDTSINPGNSGGPLFSDEGLLIGINGRGSFEKRGRVNSGAGYAISINQVKHFIDHLKGGRIVDHATLGATVATEFDGSIVVGAILEESDAFRRGLRIDDEIVTFAGRPIRSVNQFKNILGIYPSGWKLPLVYRDAQEQKHEITVTLRNLHTRSELTPKRRGPQPQPGQPGKPGEPRKPGEEKKPDGDKPQLPPGHPMIQGRPEPPAKYKHMFVEKEGFANYYFNQLEQDRVLKGIESLGDFSKVGGRWLLSGTTDGGGPFEFTLADEGYGLTMPPLVDLVNPAQGLVDAPPGTGGLLVAMHHLRTMLVSRGKLFTEFYYLGSEPLDGSGEKVDVLVATLTAVQSRWYFSKSDGSLVGFDTRLNEDSDECEIRFQGWKEFDGRRLPAQFTVRRTGDAPFAIFTLNATKLAAGQIENKAAEKPAEKQPEK